MTVALRWMGAVLAALSIAALPACALPRAARLNGICPPEHPSARKVALAFLAAPAYAEDAATLGLGAADTVNLQPLTDQNDAATCQAIEALMANEERASSPWVHSFYRVGSYYLVGVARDPAAGPVTQNGVTYYEAGFGAIGVLDAQLNVVGVFTA